MEIKEFVLNKAPQDSSQGRVKGQSRIRPVKKEKTDNVSRRVAQAKKSYAKKTHQLDIQKLKENKPLIMLCSLLLMILLTIILGMLVFKIPVVTICIVIVIETALAACLHDLPIWLHVIVTVAEIGLGIAAHQILFMSLANFCYLAAIYFLKFLREQAE